MFEKFGKNTVKAIEQFRAAMFAEHAASEQTQVAVSLGKQWREAAGIKSPADVTAYSASVFGNRWPKTKNGDAMSPLSVRLGEHFSEDADVAAIAVLCRAYNATAKEASRAAKANGEAPKRKRKRKQAKPEQAKPEQAKPEQAKPGIAKAAAMIQKESDLNWFRKIVEEAFTKKNPKAFLIFAIETEATETETKTETEAEAEKPAPKRRGRQRKAA